MQKKEEKRNFIIFKQVKATHPDKHEGTTLDFKAASSAYEAGDWAMVMIAENITCNSSSLSRFYYYERG